MAAARPRRTPATSRAEQSERSRQDIINAAFTVISRVGFRAATIDMFAAAAAISPTSIYWHFGNRDGLLTAVAHEITDAYRAAIRDELAGVSDPERFMRLYVRLISRLMLDRPELIRVQTALSSEGVVSASLRDDVRAHNVAARGPIIEMIRRGVERGVFRRIEGGLWLDFYIGALMGASIQSRLHREGYDPTPAFQAVSEAALSLLGLTVGPEDAVDAGGRNS